MVQNPQLDVVTGAFGYTGKYIARRLIESGRRVCTLTSRSRPPDEFARTIDIAPFDFDRPSRLVETLRGVSTLYNTYWVRYPYRHVTFEAAVADTQCLIRCAREAGVKRFVHFSVANPSEDSPFAYYRGKAALERSLAESGLSHAIVRPTVTFGIEDILINNIAWLLRRIPVFAVPGSGQYAIQPVFVEDVADLAVELGESRSNETVDAVGPETFTFDELVARIAKAVGSRARVVHSPIRVAVAVSRIIGWFLGDVLLTTEESGALTAGLLASEHAPTCPTRFTDWLDSHREILGATYTSELARHFR